MPRRLLSLVLFVMGLAFASTTVAFDSWPQWQGPNRDTHSERDYAGGCYVTRRIAWVRGHRRAIHDRGIVGGHIHNRRLSGLNDDCLRRRLHDGGLRRGGRCRSWSGGRRLIFYGHVLLAVALQIARLLRALAHHLHGVHHVLRDVVISVAQRGSPGEIRRHLIEDIRKLRESFHADVPGLLIRGLHELITLEAGVLLHPGVRCGDLIWIS